MMPTDAEVRQLNWEYQQVVAAQRNLIDSLQDDKHKLFNQIQRIEERVKRLEEKSSKQDLDNKMLKEELNLERKRSEILENEAAKARAFQERYEKAIVMLESLIEKKQFEKADNERFQQENQ
jgi:hypothetical protein